MGNVFAQVNTRYAWQCKQEKNDQFKGYQVMTAPVHSRLIQANQGENQYQG